VGPEPKSVGPEPLIYFYERYKKQATFWAAGVSDEVARILKSPKSYEPFVYLKPHESWSFPTTLSRPLPTDRVSSPAIPTLLWGRHHGARWERRGCGGLDVDGEGRSVWGGGVVTEGMWPARGRAAAATVSWCGSFGPELAIRARWGSRRGGTKDLAPDTRRESKEEGRHNGSSRRS
jgi:hypothetical protein